MKVEDSAEVRGGNSPPQPAGISGGLIALGFLACLVVGFFAYQPALKGPFVFDDYALPFRFPGFRGESFRDWISTVRPVLMSSYWINFQLSGKDSTLSYHIINLVIHCANSVFVYAILLKLLALFWAGERSLRIVAAFGAGVFLLHPLQTESVAYIAGRSESFSAFWCLAAFAVFLYSRTAAITWGRAFSILALFGAAAATKEHAIALVGVLVLTDIFFQPTLSLEGIKRNWRLYVPLTAAGVVAVAAALWVLSRSDSAGFSMAGLAWYEYFFTQSRVLFLYVALFLFPAGQTVDHDFTLSRTLLDHGTIFAFLMWTAIITCAILFRRRYPLACFGTLLFLILLAPTSSVVPIKDLVAERRMYLPMLGLVLVTLDGIMRLTGSAYMRAAAFATVLLLLASATYERSKAWGDAYALWESAIATTPTKIRPYGNLAALYLSQRRCVQASQVIDRAAAAIPDIGDPHFLATWGLTLECLGDRGQAIEKMEEAAARQPVAQTYAALGRMYLNAGRVPEAEQALALAEQSDATWELTYVYRGLALAARNQFEAASAEYQRALSINPENTLARQLLGELVTRSRSTP